MIKQFTTKVGYSRLKAALYGAPLALAVGACSQGDMTGSSGLDAEASLEGATNFDTVGQDLIAGCTELGVEVNAHACQHGSLGPFANRTAKTSATYNTFAATHTYYTVTFTDTTAPYVGRIDYSPSVTGDYAVYYCCRASLMMVWRSGSMMGECFEVVWPTHPGEGLARFASTM